uniref:NADH-ubiquinone oxidoreductase chain 2 n=1 Tax=Cletus rubidiventris TaxID=696880 RepID=A0A7S6UAU9_9HEMI|nr:NADH dehydrogenase subunit 2 [Cletus rubidiventris]QOW08005.1 NADH dehydrogenase subunit 2 [Cletus rubidiventris]
MNSSKILFSLMIIMSSLITLSSSNWLGMWMGLEMNLMSFIPFISKNKNKKSSKAMMIYFLTQSIGSIVLLFSIMMDSLLFMLPNDINELTKILLMISIMIKTGAAPFHLWLPEMMANLNWLECAVLMTWQKIAPLTIMNNILPNNWFLYMVALLSAAVGGIGGLNQTSLRKILAYSSINHLSWMMIFMSMNNSWYKYLVIYSVLITMVCIMLYMKNTYFINQMVSSSHSMAEKFTCITLFLSIGGLPPFLGFLPKWMVIQSMINSELYLLMVLMLLFSLITLFYYMRIMTSYILFYSTMNKFVFKYKSNMMLTYSFFSINLLMPAFLMMSFI